MKIKTGDNVIVISGKSRGTSGKVIRALPRKGLVIVEGVNVVKKHQRARKSREKGQILEKTMPIHASNVMVVDPQGGKRTRTAYKYEGGKKIRIARKSGAAL